MIWLTHNHWINCLDKIGSTSKDLYFNTKAYASKSLSTIKTTESEDGTKLNPVACLSKLTVKSAGCLEKGVETSKMVIYYCDDGCKPKDFPKTVSIQTKLLPNCINNLG